MAPETLNDFASASDVPAKSSVNWVSGLSGVLIKSEGRAVIGANSAHAVTRQRFTIAHEIGRHVLEHKGELFIDQTVRDRTVTIGRRDGRSSQGIDFQEIEANAFGAEILMPEDLVFAAVQKQLKSSGER